MADRDATFGRRGALAALGAAAIATAAGADAPSPAMGPEEQQAVAIVRAWAAALSAHDADKALAMMDEQIQYRDDPFQTDLKKGLTQARQDVAMLLRGLTSMTIQSACAVGSSKNDVLVLVRRTDAFTLGDKHISMPIAAYFRVRNGKILEWLDTPLVEMPRAPKH